MPNASVSIHMSSTLLLLRCHTAVLSLAANLSIVVSEQGSKQFLHCTLHQAT